jgi:peptidyl-prolyl cis-trans isomerase A (cyclophilin A)
MNPESAMHPNPLAKTRLLFATLMATSLLAACGGGGGDAGTPTPPPPPPPPAAVLCTPTNVNPAPAANAPQVTLTLSNGAGVNGDVVLTLDPARAPLTVANFLTYVNAGFYDGTVFHRHAPTFVLQGGGYAGPLTAGGAAPTLKATNAPITLEDNGGLSNQCLTIAMARTDAPDSANSQFFLNLNNNTFLDRTAQARGYAVFGSVTSGSNAVLTAAINAPCTAWAGFLGAGECLPSPNITITRARQTR